MTETYDMTKAVRSDAASPPSDKVAALALTPVSRETEARLDRYVALLNEWQAKTNLVAPSTLPHLWTRLIGYAGPLVKKGAKALFLKGQDVEAELTEATKYWNIKPNLHSSRTGGGGWIVELDHIERRTQSASANGSRA